MPAGRVAGKFGYDSNSYYTGIFFLSFCDGPKYFMQIWSIDISLNLTGRSYHGYNEEIIWASIGMAITIAVLIALGLCYIVYEKCQKKREYYINA